VFIEGLVRYPPSVHSALPRGPWLPGTGGRIGIFVPKGSFSFDIRLIESLCRIAHDNFCRL
jgi:hypothetical protein